MKCFSAIKAAYLRYTERNRILRGTFYAQFFTFIVSSLTTSVGTMVDGVIIGRHLGVDSIAAFGVVSPLMIFFALAGAITASGARNRFTGLMGYGRKKEALSVFSLSCVLSVSFALLLSAVVIPLSTPVCAMMGASGNAANLLPKASRYLVGIAIGLPAMNLMRTLNTYMPLDNDRHMPIISSITVTVTDIALDLAVVAINGDTFEMGLATSLSYYAAASVMLLHFRRKSSILRFSVRNLPWRETGAILRKGLPSGIFRLSNTVRSTFMNRLLSAIAASAAIAAYSVHRQTDSFLNPLTVGMADTVAMLAAVLMGEEDRPTISGLMRIYTHASLVLITLISAICWFLAPGFAALYIKDQPETLEMSIRAVRCYVVAMPLYAMNISYVSYLQGIGKSRLSSVTGFLMEGGLLMLSAGVLAFWFGAKAAWLAFPVTQALMFICLTTIELCISSRLGLRDEPFWNRMILLPRSFDVAPEDRLDRSITSMEDVMRLSREVEDFCRAHHCDPRRAYLLSLSVEEMAGNAVIHGFADGKRHSVETRVLKKGDDYILRIRDDCRIFDPTSQIQLLSEEDRTRHIGLRMIMGMASEVKYTCVLKLNNLLLRV